MLPSREKKCVKVFLKTGSWQSSVFEWIWQTVYRYQSSCCR